ISSIAAYDQLKKTTGLPLTGARSSDRSQYPGYQGKIMEAELRALFQDRSPLACLADPASYTFTPKNSQTVLEGAAGQG
ncbi:hypothetical protein DYH09_31655, partial [bacterium CPR1]|nr:hypothetical protein [bacterium CPR1]